MADRHPAAALLAVTAAATAAALLLWLAMAWAPPRIDVLTTLGAQLPGIAIAAVTLCRFLQDWLLIALMVGAGCLLVGLRLARSAHTALVFVAGALTTVILLLACGVVWIGITYPIEELRRAMQGP